MKFNEQLRIRLALPSPRLRVLLIAATAVVLAVAGPASSNTLISPFAGARLPAHHTAAANQPADQSLVDAEIPEIVFPVVGPVTYSDTWGACRGPRCSRSHKGVDIFTHKLTPVVAAEDGVLSFIRTSSLTISGNAVVVTADSGWRYLYIHLNNDTPGTDDGANPQGWIVPNRLTAGDRVTAGQVIGYLGDSGNAETTPAHVHFETHRPGVGAVNPTRIVDAAKDAGRVVSVSGLASTPEGRAQYQELIVGWYQALLNREPTKVELFAWADRFDIGFATEDDLIADLTMDRGRRNPAGTVVRAFAVVLGRSPTANELTQWERVVAEGMTTVEVVDVLLASGAFADQHGSPSDDELITVLFDNLRGQQPTDEARSDWRQRLSDTSRPAVAAELADSYQAKDAFWHELEVIQAYRAALDRMPDNEELDRWVSHLDDDGVLPDVVEAIRTS